MSANNQNVYLKATRYGKDLVRLLRVYREGQTQRCTELTVSTLSAPWAMAISNEETRHRLSFYTFI
jgi:hypothetical protein